jgi:uncharacterized UPF0160 family protein
MKPTRIITHDGIFHCDDAFAIALIHEVFGNDVPVERTRNISMEDLENEEVWVVDVGGECSFIRGNFDHHHSDELPASCMLVLNYLFANGYVSEELYNELFDNFVTISNIDCKGPSLYSGFQVNSLIKSFNSLENGWEIALQTAKCSIQSAKDTVDKMKESKEIWDRGENVTLFVKMCDKFPIHWKRYQEANFLIYPNNGKWNLLSIDGAKFPIHPTGFEEFIHNGKFIAVYKTQEEAISAAVYTEQMTY